MSVEHRGRSGEVERLLGVVHLYRLLLRRTVDRGGLLHHAERIDRGESLEVVADSLLHTDEGRKNWEGMAPAGIAHRIWQAAGGEPEGFDPAWTAAGSVPALVALLVRGARVRETSVLEALFPAGVDPAADDVYPGWAYRLWADETDRALVAVARRLFPLLRAIGPRIQLLIELGPGDSREQLDATIASLSGQVFGRWRLVLRGSLPAGFVLPADTRITAAGADDALPRTGWIGRLQAGDTLSPAALALLGFAICRRPWADAVCCDEDRRRDDGSCVDPVLPGRSLPAEERPGFFLLRQTKRGTKRRTKRRRDAGPGEGRLVHLPAILCHRLARFGPPVPEERVTATPMPPVSVVIATRDRAELLESCVGSLRACTDHPSVEVVLVDNGSTEPSALALLDRLERDGCRVLRRPGPFNWSALNNDGVAAAAGEIVVLMNNDVQCVEPGWLRAMVQVCLLPGAGAVGALLRYRDGTIQHAGVVLGPGPQAAHLRCEDGRLPRVEAVPAVTGACMAVSRTVFGRMCGLDESLPVTWNDLDFCLRLRKAGLRVLLARDAVLLHDELGSRTPDSDPVNRRQLERSRLLVASRHRRALRRERFLHPLLTAGSGGCCLDPAAPRRAWPMLRGGGRVVGGL